MMEELTDWYLDTGVHGFFILGSQGQGLATTIEQRKGIAEWVVRRVNKRLRASFRSALATLTPAPKKKLAV